MNKAFVREPEDDGRVYCPACGTLGLPVGPGPLDAHIRPGIRDKLGASAWFCSDPPCDVAYFDAFNGRVHAAELNGPVFPKDMEANLCACFGFTQDEIDADIADGAPTRIRALLEKSQSDAARCQSLAADGRCCLTTIKRLYRKRRGEP